jgi:hypothetical protein
MLDALETEGTASPTPSPPSGLAEGVSLSEYQFEALGWMLARERSAFALEDLFVRDLSLACSVCSLAKGLTLTTLPGGGVTLGGAPRRPRHRGGILAEEMGIVSCRVRTVGCSQRNTQKFVSCRFLHSSSTYIPSHIPWHLQKIRFYMYIV